MIFPGETTYKGIKDIKYVLYPSDSEWLIVSFSAFSKAGNPPSYNYTKVLSNTNCNRLHILDDYGPRASYYVGENGDLSIELSVISLIEEICVSRGIPFSNVISLGSSKGGWAALYYGFKYGFGHVISGSPQTRMGYYLLQEARGGDVAQYISGGKSETHQSYLDNLLFDAVRSSNKCPSVNIHVGERERHRFNHVDPFVDALSDLGIAYELNFGDYDSHSEVSKHFPKYMLQKIENIVNVS